MEVNKEVTATGNKNDKTNIKYSPVEVAATTIKKCATDMQSIFDDFSLQIQQASSDDVFMGEASEELKLQFNSLKGQFPLYYNNVNEFADTISKASGENKQTEHSLAGAAAELRSNIQNMPM